MATRNKRKLAALNKGNREEHPRSNLAQNSNAPRSQEDYITQFSEELEGRVTEKLSQEFSRTENRILGALARLDDFLMNPRIQGHSGTAPETSRNIFSTSQGTNEDDSQSNSHPEAAIFNNQMTQNSGPEDGHDSNTQITFWVETAVIRQLDLQSNGVLNSYSSLMASFKRLTVNSTQIKDSTEQETYWAAEKTTRESGHSLLATLPELVNSRRNSS